MPKHTLTCANRFKCLVSSEKKFMHSQKKCYNFSLRNGISREKKRTHNLWNSTGELNFITLTESMFLWIYIHRWVESLINIYHGQAFTSKALYFICCLWIDFALIIWFVSALHFFFVLLLVSNFSVHCVSASVEIVFKFRLFLGC